MAGKRDMERKEGDKKERKAGVKRRKLDIDGEKLIMEIQNHRCIWDKASPLYKDKGKTYFAWKSVSKALEISERELKTKWKNLCDTFRRTLDTAKGKSGDGLDEEKLEAVTWKHWKSMLFFKDSYIRRRTLSNYENDDSDDDEEGTPDKEDICDIEENEDNVFEESSLVSNDREETTLDVPTQRNASDASAEVPQGSNAPVKKKSAGRKVSPDVVLEKLSQNADLLKQVFVDPQAEASSKFLGYLGESLDLVPENRKRKCEQALLNLVNSYIDGIEVQVSQPNPTFYLSQYSQDI